MPTFFLGVQTRQDLDPDLGSTVRTCLPMDLPVEESLESEHHRMWAWTSGREEVFADPAWRDGDRAAALAGYCYESGSGEPASAADCADGSFPTIRDDHGGEWSLLQFGPDGMIAGSSRLGTEHVYTLETPELAAVSNRARLLWGLLLVTGHELRPDYEALSTLLTKGYPFCTDRTAVEGVEIVPSDRYVRLDAQSGELETRETDRTFFLPRSDERGSPDWSGLSERLEANLELVVRTDTPTNMALTGGKDSRLVLAALASRGDTAAIDEYYLRAPEQHADALVAERIADRLDLPFHRSDRDGDTSLIDELRRHVVHTEGALNAWDMKAGDPGDPTIGIHGLLGELYRGKGELSVDRPDRAAGQILGTFHGWLGLFRADVVDDWHARTTEWLRDLVDDGAPVRLAKDLFYLRQRIPRWMGQGKLHDGLSGLQVNPLYDVELLRSSYRLAQVSRDTERLHYETMARLDPELTTMPFAEARWDPEMVAASDRPDLEVSRTPVDHGGPIETVDWRRRTLRANWDELRAEIEAGKDDWETIVRPEGVTALLDAAEVLLGLGSRLGRTGTAFRSPRAYARQLVAPQSTLFAVYGLATLRALEHELDALTDDLRTLSHVSG